MRNRYIYNFEWSHRHGPCPFLLYTQSGRHCLLLDFFSQPEFRPDRGFPSLFGRPLLNDVLKANSSLSSSTFPVNCLTKDPPGKEFMLSAELNWLAIVRGFTHSADWSAGALWVVLGFDSRCTQVMQEYGMQPCRHWTNIWAWSPPRAGSGDIDWTRFSTAEHRLQSYH